MGCACGTGGCSTKSSSEGEVAGCASGGCSSGGCNKLNTYDWLSDFSFTDVDNTNLIEISFKQGSRKSFYRNVHSLNIKKGDLVVLESSGGLDIGEVSLTGPLVLHQMRKKKIPTSSDKILKILRLASEYDIEKMILAKAKEYDTLIRSRVLARDLKLDMKIGDVEFQADGKKATFYYTADNRVDFRELIKVFAGEFRIKVEMRQIGTRQEAGKIGGIGSCGRELCCSSWLTNFSTVTTSAARYQQLAINQSKLSGQCGRLKCCLNFELDSYVDALKVFPKKADKLKFKEEDASMVKMDIFGGSIQYYLLSTRKYITLEVNEVHDILNQNKKGILPDNLEQIIQNLEQIDDVEEFVDTVGQTTLQQLNKTDKKNKRRNRRNRPSSNQNPTKDSKQSKESGPAKRPRRNRPKTNKEQPTKNPNSNNPNKSKNQKK